MSVWSGAGIPVINNLILSGTQTIVLHLDDYIAEHPTVGVEGGVVERVGKRADRIELHGIFWESGADANLVTLSGLLTGLRDIAIPSTISGNYFLTSSKVWFEHLDYQYVAGHGYPYYQWRLLGVISGGIIAAQLSGLFGITYVQPNVVTAQIYGTYLQPNVINSQMYADYVRPNVVYTQIYADYLRPNQVNQQVYGSYCLISGVSGY